VAPLKICVLYGGRSGEHEVSLRSAASVVKNLDPARYEITAVGIDKTGRWHLQSRMHVETREGQGDVLTLVPADQPLSIVPGDGIHDRGKKLSFDCIFPVLHGTFGEDGTVQGLLELAGLPYVGAGVLGSAASMDKETAKRLWRDAGLPVVDFEPINRETSEDDRRKAARRLGWPVFVKPCSAGSSLGASRADNDAQLAGAVVEALRFDTRALLEKCMDAREIECAVIGNAHPRAFLPGEIVPSRNHPFYDYDAKYTDPDGASLEAPARLDAATQKRIMAAAESAYAAVRCEGMARVDFFLEKGSGNVLINEINTIPGFTSISMFPRMAQASGLPYPRLLDELVRLAMERDELRRTVLFEKP
jgi:D-alanine-D-alanine ligase